MNSLDASNDLYLKDSKLLTWGASAFFVFVLCVLTYRIHFSVDFTDEALYVGMPLRFAEGAVPFRDEYFIQQTATLVLVPITRSFLNFFGREGIVLFFRYLYVLMALSASFAILSIFTKSIGRWRSLLLATLPLSAVYYSIPNMSYNTMGAFGLLLGPLLLIGGNESERPNLSYLIGGIVLALCCLAYLPLTPACAISFFSLLRLQSTSRRDCFFAALIGGLLVLGALGVWIFSRIPPAQILQSLFFTRDQSHPLNWWKLREVWLALKGWCPWSLWASLIALSFLCRRPRIPALLEGILRLGGLLGAMIAMVALFNGPEPFLYWNCIGVSSVVLGCLLGSLTRNKAILQGLLFPSLIGGILSAWSGAHSRYALQVGIFPALVCSGYFILSAVTPPKKRENLLISKLNPCVAVSSFILIVFNLLAYQFTSVYRDAAFFSLTERINSGPFQGIYTTRYRREFLDKLQEKIDKIDREKEPVLFFPDFPAGVLMSRSPLSAGCATWLPQMMSEQPKYQSYFGPCFDRLRGEETTIFLFNCGKAKHAIDCVSPIHFLFHALKTASLSL